MKAILIVSLFIVSTNGCFFINCGSGYKWGKRNGRNDDPLYLSNNKLPMIQVNLGQEYQQVMYNRTYV